MASEIAYQTEIFSNRLSKRHKHLWKWARKNQVSCFRVYDRDIPEVPLVVDRYQDFLHMAEYHSPHKDLPGSPEEYAHAMRDAAARALGFRPDHVFYKLRRKTARGEQYEKLDGASVETTVTESGLSFVINLSDYLDTGLFLDHRITRAMVRDMVSEMSESRRPRVLNLFSYTGSFSVYAASGGAAETVSVDMSNTYSKWAERNLELNGFNGPAHRGVTRDVFEFLENEPRSGGYDVVVLDPPTFSNSKKMDRTLDIQRDHGELLARCARFLRHDGMIVFSTNNRSFKIDPELPERLVATDISSRTIPPDFRNQRIHKCWIIERA